MSPPLSSSVKERVIQLHQEGKGRNEIAQTLNLSHIRISQGSVTNVLRAYKANTGEASTKKLQSKWLPFSPNYLLNHQGFSPSTQVSEVEVPIQVQTDSNQTSPTASSSHSSDDSESKRKNHLL